jgi:hypothetical protein
MASWNPWKTTTIAMVLMLATALVTGIVVANWTGGASEHKITAEPAKAPRAAAGPRAVTAQAVPAVPTQDVVDACNRYAASQVGQRDKTLDTVKDGAIGAVVGAAVGAAGGAIADGGKGAGKGAGIGGIVGAGAGTLYGLSENKKHDERYREAYAGCMRSRGYAG